MAVRVPTQEEIAAILIAHGITDFVSGGKLSLIERKYLWKVLKKAGVVAGRQTVRAAPRIVGTAAILARRHPVILAASLVGAGLIYEDEIDQVVKDIQENARYTRELLQELERRGAPAGRGVSAAGEFFMERLPGRQRDYSGGRSFGVLPTQTRKKRPSKFNNAVKAGMAVIKKSTSYGKKGTIKPAKKAFSVVVKLASAKSKKRKAPKSGIKRKIWNAMRGY